ncbi:MAG: HalD/BesD family halogenase [Ilumatobacteraceae bacterium]
MTASIAEIVDLDRYPLDQIGSPQWERLVADCQAALRDHGMYDLPGFVRPAVIAATATTLLPRMADESYAVNRTHNIYFLDHIDGLADDHPALTKMLTANHTLCGDQLTDTALTTLYEWEPFQAFIAATVGKPKLHPMADPLACVNVLSYRPGQSLNWHFDRSEFTTTIVLQQPTGGGVFEYRRALRTATDPNYEGVAAVVLERDPEVQRIVIEPGALNVFLGKDTAHRVTTVAGDLERMVAVLSYYEQPGVVFSDTDNLGFYGRTAS